MSGPVERRLAAGCVGGMALAAAGTWLRFALEGTLAIDTHTASFVAASAVSGAGLVLAGVCSLRLAPRAGALSWRTLGAWALAAQVAAFASLALTSTDAFTNLWFGERSLAGFSPYAPAPGGLAHSAMASFVPPRWAGKPCIYGPLNQVLFSTAAWAGARMGAPTFGALYAYKALLMAVVLAALALAAGHLRRTCTPADAKETFVALAMGPLVAWEVTAQGHNDGLLLLAVVAFVVAASRGTEMVAAAALAAGVAVKYSLAPLLGLFLLLVARRSMRRAVVLALVATVTLAVCVAPEWQNFTMRSMAPLLGGDGSFHAHSLADLVCMVLDALGRHQASFAAYRLLSTASALLCIALLLRAARRSRTLEELGRGYLLFLMALYLTGAWFQPWYVCWALPLVLVERDPRWRRFVATFAVVTVVQWAAPLDPVTTVLGDIWAAWAMWRLVRQRAAAPALTTAAS